MSPFTCVAQAVSARGQVLRIRVFPVRYQVNVELPYLYYPIKTLPDTVYFDTDNARLFSASTLPGLEQAYAQLYDGSGYTLFLALQSEGGFEVRFSGGRFKYSGLNNAEMLAGLMVCAERQLEDFDISAS
ncbi:MAG: hypothetical protein GQ535_14525 [Rhodobacteraceae bacterium]|nr:hypothetical protein [Paracoccaceae bacterium]